MARRRKFRGYVSLPALGDLPNPLKFSADGQDVLVGAAAGFVGSQVVSAAGQQFAPSLFTGTGLLAADGMLGKALPLVTGAAVAAALYYGQGQSRRGQGHALGALAVGAAQTLGKFIAGMPIPGLNGTFSEVAQVNLGRYGGLLVNDNSGNYGRYGGLLIDDNTNTDSSMAQMAGLSMGDDDDGMYDLVNIPGAGG